MPTSDAAPTTRWTRGRIAAVVTVALLVGMWGYVVYLAFGPGRSDPPDRLDDPAFAVAAETRCGEALDAVAALPLATDTPTAQERAAVVDAANAHFAAMLDDLEAIAPDGEDGRLVRAWLTDWHTYLDDRDAFASALRADPEARLLVSARDRDQITEYLDAFAADNRMPACGTPLDV